MTRNGAELESLKRSTIMMVDDEETTLDVLEAFLESEGYSRFVATTDSTEAVSLALAERPDVLLLDLNMPGVGGFEVLESIRADESLRHTPVIILTSAKDAETKLRALELGATDFLGKPVDPSELALRLRNTLTAKAYQDRLAYYDGTTGLPNRQLFVRQAERVLRRARRQQRQVAILHLALHKIDRIHDAFGDEIGDTLVRAVADRLQQCVRSTDLVASASFGRTLSRVGAHEFTLLVPAGESAKEASRLAQRLVSAFSKPFVWDDRDLHLACSIGIALFPHDADDVQVLLRQARMAQEKGDSRSTYRFYRHSLDRDALARLDLEAQLRRAVERDELVLHYQPQLELSSGRIVGVEGLMRWEHPDLGLLPPGRFIPIAEETGLIDQMGALALERACRDAQAWRKAGLGSLRVSVNVSSLQFRHGDLLTRVGEALRASGLDGRQLVLELTESMIMHEPRRAAKTLEAVKALDVGLSVDDFGTGYSTLSYLKTFPLDELKIDRSFVAGLPGNGDDAAIVKAIVALGHSLGLRVLAEGVESPEQRAFLSETGCDEFQGFLFRKAIPEPELRALLAGSAAPRG